MVTLHNIMILQLWNSRNSTAYGVEYFTRKLYKKEISYHDEVFLYSVYQAKNKINLENCSHWERLLTHNFNKKKIVLAKGKY